MHCVSTSSVGTLPQDVGTFPTSVGILSQDKKYSPLGLWAKIQEIY
ncbi:hypothetical protein [Capnocytophaga catalasegens]|nr:hypothetical protein [Capnocytophaga catalasegens]